MEQSCLKTLNQFVDKSRSKLLAEFEEWYRVCYIGGEPMDSAIVEEESEFGHMPGHNRKVRKIEARPSIIS